MTKAALNAASWDAPPLMAVLGVVALLGVALYFAYVAAESYGLVDRRGTAMVIEKEYRPARQTYATQIIGGRAHTVPQAEPETYVAHLAIGDQHAEAAVPKDVYDAVRPGDRVPVVYRRLRLSGALAVVKIDPLNAKR